MRTLACAVVATLLAACPAQRDTSPAPSVGPTTTVTEPEPSPSAPDAAPDDSVSTTDAAPPDPHAGEPKTIPPVAGPKPCPEGRCLFDGQCVLPGGPIQGPGMPDNRTYGACGGDLDCTPCKCAAPDTPIATPHGEIAIAELRVGDLVYSVDRSALRAVPLRKTSRVSVGSHVVVRVTLATGAVLSISPGHPTADGRTFADLTPGSLLDSARVDRTELVAYTAPFTHDILPASDTGTYVAAGVIIGSTLATANASATERDHAGHDERGEHRARRE